MQGMVKRILETALKMKERTKVFREIQETIEITLETMKYELIEENTLNQVLKEIAEITTKMPCNIINHPTTTVKELLNTPNIKIQQLQIMKTIACREIKMYDVVEISTTFKAETIEIQTPQKKYIIISDILEVKPGW
jgi:hypothetical protein